jgi:hypothetical protein
MESTRGRFQDAVSMHRPRLLTQLRTGFKISAHIRPAIMNFASIHGIKKRTSVVKRQWKKLNDPIGGIRFGERFPLGGDSRFTSNIHRSDQDRKGSATRTAAITFVASFGHHY